MNTEKSMLTMEQTTIEIPDLNLSDLSFEGSGNASIETFGTEGSAEQENPFHNATLNVLDCGFTCGASCGRTAG